ncbi:MAG: hypothetical protein ACFFE4_00415 [Candidatus Thorarchaeota archaeon]
MIIGGTMTAVMAKAVMPWVVVTLSGIFGNMADRANNPEKYNHRFESKHKIISTSQELVNERNKALNEFSR